MALVNKSSLITWTPIVAGMGLMLAASFISPQESTDSDAKSSKQWSQMCTVMGVCVMFGPGLVRWGINQRNENRAWKENFPEMLYEKTGLRLPPDFKVQPE